MANGSFRDMFRPDCSELIKSVTAFAPTNKLEHPALMFLGKDSAVALAIAVALKDEELTCVEYVNEPEFSAWACTHRDAAILLRAHARKGGEQMAQIIDDVIEGGVIFLKVTKDGLVLDKVLGNKSVMMHKTPFDDVAECQGLTLWQDARQSLVNLSLPSGAKVTVCGKTGMETLQAELLVTAALERKIPHPMTGELVSTTTTFLEDLLFFGFNGNPRPVAEAIRALNKVDKKAARRLRTVLWSSNRLRPLAEATDRELS